MSDRLEDTSLRLKDEMDLYKRMMDKLRQNRLEFQKEREATQEVGPGAGRCQGSRPAPTHAPPPAPRQPASCPRSSSRTCARSWSTCRCTSWTASGRAGAAARPPAWASSMPGPERWSWSMRSSDSSRWAPGASGPRGKVSRSPPGGSPVRG